MTSKVRTDNGKWIQNLGKVWGKKGKYIYNAVSVMIPSCHDVLNYRGTSDMQKNKYCMEGKSLFLLYDKVSVKWSVCVVNYMKISQNYSYKE